MKYLYSILSGIVIVMGLLLFVYPVFFNEIFILPILFISILLLGGYVATPLSRSKKKPLFA